MATQIGFSNASSWPPSEFEDRSQGIIGGGLVFCAATLLLFGRSSWLLPTDSSLSFLLTAVQLAAAGGIVLSAAGLLAINLKYWLVQTEDGERQTATQSESTAIPLGVVLAHLKDGLIFGGSAAVSSFMVDQNAATAVLIGAICWLGISGITLMLKRGPLTTLIQKALHA